MRTLLARLMAVVACAAVPTIGAVGVPAAHASFGFKPNSFSVTTSSQQAGAHPDLTTSFAFNTADNGNGEELPDGNVRDVQIDLPTGLVGNAASIPRCEEIQLENLACPVSSRVGTAVLPLRLFIPGPLPQTVGVYNMVPGPGQTAMLGFSALVTRVHVVISVRPGDLGLRATLTGISSVSDLYGSTMTLWGVPADPGHDADRGGPAGVPPAPFLSNPTTCGAPLTGYIAATSWQAPNAPPAAASSTIAPTTGCERLHFEPSIEVQPQVQQVDTPSGYDITLKVPQNGDPGGLATANLRKAVVKLPAGVTLNPAVADGLRACSDEELGFGTAAAPSCPGASKLGKATLKTPALPDELTGSIYLRPQRPDDPYRIALVLAGDGVTIKLPGSVHADPVTGQLTTVFDDAPQQPFSEMTLHFKGGDRAPLTTPASCGTATTTTVLSPWSALDPTMDKTPSSGFDVSWDGAGAACPSALPFTPGFSAGVTDPSAGVSSPFTFRLTRGDRQQTLNTVTGVQLPAGLTARVAGVPLCGSADAAAGTCGGASQIGSALVGSGAGGHPLYLHGKVFLTESYKGAPYGLSIAVPAIAGPFDLGTVVVRAAVAVNRDASLTVDADPMPTILQGVPLRLRDVVLDLSRPGFMVNPTNCTPMKINAKVSSAETAVDLQRPFQVVGCAALPLKPKLTLSLSGKRQTTKRRVVAHAAAGAAAVPTAKSLGLTDGGHPALDADLTMGPGGANLKTAEVTLPLSMALDSVNANGLCEPAEAEANTCPAKSIVGNVRAITPILNEPLTGPVYFVRGERIDAKTSRVRTTLPKLFIPLKGENGIRIDLHASSHVDAIGRLVTTFDKIPDAPVSDLKLHIDGGAHGILAVSGANLCTADQPVDQRYTGQNDLVKEATIIASNNCPFAISSTSHSVTALNVKVGGVTAGRISISATGTSKVSRTISAAGTVASVSLQLSKRIRAKLAKGTNVKVTVKVSYTRKGAKKAKKLTKTVVIHGSKKSKK